MTSLPAKDANSIRIMSYNAHLFGGTVAGITQSHDDNDRMKKICDYVKNSNIDIACFCEVWADGMKQSIVENLDSSHPYSMYFDTSFLLQGDGLLVCSKHPLYNRGFEQFDNLNGWDILAQKGVFFCCVNFKEDETSKDFRLILSHTQAGEDSTSIANRQKNITEMANKVKSETYYPNTPTIICGDLNVGSSNPDQYQNMMNQFKDKDGAAYIDSGVSSNDSTYDIENNALAKLWKQEGDKTDRLDYILHNARVGVTAFSRINYWKYETGEDCSDHYPLIADISILEECTIPNDEYTTLAEATEATNDAKEKYGNGVSNLITIANNSDYRIEYHDNYSWRGKYEFLEPSHEVYPRQYGAAFHHHPNTTGFGSWGCMIYRVYKNKTAMCDVFLGFEAPHTVAKNSVYVEVRGIDHWWEEGSKKYMKEKINDSGYNSSDENTMISVSGHIDTGTSPSTTFTIEMSNGGYSTMADAKNAAQQAKDSYGNGVSNLITIANNSKYSMTFHDYYDWRGKFEFLNPTPLISPQKYGAAFHHHPNTTGFGSWGCMIYRVYKDNTAICDVFLGFEAPHSAAKNSVYVEVNVVDHWWGTESKDTMKEKVDDGSYSSSSSWGSFSVSGDIDGGTSPLTTFHFDDK